MLLIKNNKEEERETEKEKSYTAGAQKYYVSINCYVCCFTHRPPVQFWLPQVFGRYTAFQFCPFRWFWYPYETETCVEHVKAWMECNKLKLNGDKTEALVVDTRSSYNEHLEIGVVRFRFSPRLRVWELSSTLASPCLITLALSVVLPTLSCAESVPSVHSSLQVWLQLLFVLEFYLGLITAIPYWQVFLQIRRPDFKDYWTTQLGWSSIKKRSEHVTTMLISLHWLPIKQRIQYKLATLAFRYFDGTSPPLPLTLSLLVHSPQIPSIVFWQTALCPTC